MNVGYCQHIQNVPPFLSSFGTQQEIQNKERTKNIKNCRVHIHTPWVDFVPKVCHYNHAHPEMSSSKPNNNGKTEVQHYI